jgi:hypothetical protein
MNTEKKDGPLAFNHAAHIVFLTVGKVLAEANRLFAAGEVDEALLMTRAWGEGRCAQRLVEQMALEGGQTLSYDDPWLVRK